jgi:hypothetical protein
MIIIWIMMALGNIPARAQSDLQQSILTDLGIVTVSQTHEGLDLVILPANIWKTMASGTSCACDRLIDSQAIYCYIEIASKEKGHCRKGIGFACSIYPCPANAIDYPLRVNDKNRFCRVMLQRDGAASVRIIFLDEVDWQDLANTP